MPAMSDPNPFAPSDVDDPVPAGDPLAEASLYLRQSRPWMGILGALAGLATLFCLVSATTSVRALAATGTGPNHMVAWFTALYLGLSLFYAVPTYLIARQMQAIGTLLDGRDRPRALATVLRHNRDLWRFMAIGILLFFVVYCGGIAAVLSLSPGLVNP